MAITLVSMPPEIILMIAEELDDDKDVSNFRLACRRFGELGRAALSTDVFLAPLPQSIKRLRDISLDPFFSHHINTITCSLRVFASYNNFEVWQDALKTSERHVGYYTPSQWQTSLAKYDALLEDQNAALTGPELLKDLEMACRNFTNLRIIEIDCRKPDWLPPHIRKNRLYQSLVQTHGSLKNCLRVPWIHSKTYESVTTPPANNFLSSLLSNTARLTSLGIDALAADVFNGEGETDMYSMMKKASPDLCVLLLSIRGDREFEGQQDAQRGMFRNRLKSLLFSAPHLQIIELTYHISYYSRRVFLISIAYILPRKCTWSNLRILKLSNAEMIVSVFVDFISAHGQTLEVLELEECSLRHRKLRQSCWSDIFIPLLTKGNLRRLELSGRFFLPKRPGPVRSPRGPPYIDMSDRVWNAKLQFMPLQLAAALDLLICSKRFNAHLHETVSIHGISVMWIKEEILRDLLDHDPVERPIRGLIDIPTKHLCLFLSYAESLLSDSIPPVEWQSPISDSDF